MGDDLKQSIAHLARQIGFDLFGVSAPAIDDETRRRFRDWLGRSYHGGMDYLARNVEKRLDPTQLMATVKSIICVAVSYYQPPIAVDAGAGRVAMYAWGADYHRIVKAMLHRLAREIETLTAGKVTWRAFVDSAPVLEKVLAWQAGLGWIGSNACLINDKMGSYFFLGELFVDLELEPDAPAKNRCGTCRRCLDRCPTAAIIEPGIVDAKRCISYLTIEHPGRIDRALADKMKGWIFGCDVCQQACPFNRFARTTSIQEFLDHQLGPQIKPEDVLTWDEPTYRACLADSAASRTDLARWQRNAKLLLSNKAAAAVENSERHCR